MAPPEKGIIMEDTDDLPPKKERDVEDRSFFESLGELFGASIWIILFLAVAGVALYAVLHWSA